MKSSNDVLAGNQLLTIVFLWVMNSCSQHEVKLQPGSVKVFEKPFVAADPKPPVVTLLDTCPAPQTIIVPLKPGGTYTIKTDTGTRRISLLPPTSTPAD